MMFKSKSTSLGSNQQRMPQCTIRYIVALDQAGQDRASAGGRLPCYGCKMRQTVPRGRSRGCQTLGSSQRGQAAPMGENAGFIGHQMWGQECCHIVSWVLLSAEQTHFSKGFTSVSMHAAAAAAAGIGLHAACKQL